MMCIITLSLPVSTEAKNDHFCRLADNPFCHNGLVAQCSCNNNGQESGSDASYKTPVFCVVPECTSGQMSSSTCKCAYPYTGIMIVRAPSISALGNEKYYTALQTTLIGTFVNLSLPVEAVSVNNVSMNAFGYLSMHLAFFPANQDHFNRTAISMIGFVLSNQTYQPPSEFKPYVFEAEDYTHFEGDSNMHFHSN